MYSSENDTPLVVTSTGVSKIAEMRHRQGGVSTPKALFLMQNLKKVYDENGVIDKGECQVRVIDRGGKQSSLHNAWLKLALFQKRTSILVVFSLKKA